MADNKLRQSLIVHLVPAALNVTLVGIAMIDRSLGIGVMGGLILGAITSAIRSHRREQRRLSRVDKLSKFINATVDPQERKGT